MTVNNITISSPMTFRFLGGYLRVGMPFSCWRNWSSYDWRSSDTRVRMFCAGPFFAFARVEKGTFAQPSYGFFFSLHTADPGSKPATSAADYTGYARADGPRDWSSVVIVHRAPSLRARVVGWLRRLADSYLRGA